MTNLFALFLSLGFIIMPTPKISAEITEIENERAVVEVFVDKGYQTDVYQFDFPTSETEYEEGIQNAFVGRELDIGLAYGTFYSSFKDGSTVMYEFKSYDNDVWWIVSEDEIDFIPIFKRLYVLVYDENGTTKETHNCPEEYNCDCYCYNDLFLGVYEL